MTTIPSEMLLAFDTSSAACTVALFDTGGTCIARKDEVIGRGHAERLVPMISELMAGRRADRILVGVGPGSFTGIRVAIAAAHGLAIGWDAELQGMSSLGLLVAGFEGCRTVGAAVTGGHGELFVQQFVGQTLEPLSEVANAVPAAAAKLIDAELVVGSGAHQLIDARGWGKASDALLSAANALRLPQQLRTLGSKPIYVRAPDARVPEAA